MLQVFAFLLAAYSPGLEGSSFVAVFIKLTVKPGTEQNQRNACFGTGGGNLVQLKEDSLAIVKFTLLLLDKLPLLISQYSNRQRMQAWAGAIVWAEAVALLVDAHPACCKTLGPIPSPTKTECGLAHVCSPRT